MWTPTLDRDAEGEKVWGDRMMKTQMKEGDPENTQDGKQEQQNISQNSL